MVVDPFLGTVLDATYRLNARIGTGGTGTIYQADHLFLQRTVAVKLLRADPGSSAEMERPIQRTARAAGWLSHPNIVTFYDCGQTSDGTLYLAMEFVEGTNLKELIRARGPIAPDRAVAMLKQAASALAHAHSMGVLHRDLKPQNLMVSVDQDGHEVVKLLDFGIAQIFGETTQLTETGASVGTPHYMSPEQARGEVIDARTDIYALGVLLYEVLVGDVPFHAPSTAGVLLKIVSESPVPPSRRRPELHVPPALEAVVLTCLEKDPAKRFPSAGEFAAALARSLDPLPISNGRTIDD